MRVCLEIGCVIANLFPHPGGECPVVGATCQLDRPKPLEALPVAGLHIAEVAASLISFAARIFFEGAEAVAFMGELGEEMRDPQRPVDLEEIHQRR